MDTQMVEPVDTTWEEVYEMSDDIEDFIQDDFDEESDDDIEYEEDELEVFPSTSGLQYKDETTERLLDALAEYFTFATKWDLIKLIVSNF